MYDKIMKKALDSANKEGAFVDGDYYSPCFDDEPDLKVLHCGTCGKRKEFAPYIPVRPYPANEIAPKAERKYFYENGRVRIAAVPCACEQNEKKAQEKRVITFRRATERKLDCWGYEGDYGAKIRNRAMEKETFEKYQMNKHIKACIRYLEKLKEMFEQGQGLMLCGKAGAGKTAATMCLANAIMDRAFKVCYKQQIEIVSLSQYDDKSKLEELQSCTVLFIDDFNPDMLTDYGREVIFNLFEIRIKRNLPTIFTSNITKNGIENPINSKDKRIMDRIIQKCYIVEDSTNNYRRN